MKRVLVVELAYIGDTLLTTPFLRVLKSVFPKSEIAFLGVPQSLKILQTNPHLSECIPYDKRKGWHETRRVLSVLREKQFQCAFLLHRSFASAFLCWLARIPVRIGYATEGREGFLTASFPYHASLHRAINHLRLLEYHLARSGSATSPFPVPYSSFRPSGFSSTSPRFLSLELPVPSGLQEQVKTKFLQNTGDYLVLNPAGSWETKRWLAEGFAKVGNCFYEKKGWKPVIVGGEEDISVSEAVQSALSVPFVNLTGKMELMELAAVLQTARGFLTNDSGPMHIGVAVGVPTVAIFGPTDPTLTGPVGGKSLVLSTRPFCSPCYLKKCPPRRHFICMHSLSADEVIRQMVEFLIKYE